MNLSLKQHNKEALRWFFNRRVGALFMEMRLGKSVVAICKANISGCKKNLIIAPYSAIPDWESLLGSNFITITGNKNIEQIKEDFEKDVHWYIVNRELHRKFDFSAYPWEFVCIDESTTIANPQAEVTRYFMRECWQKVQYKMVMSGTAALKSELQYFTQLYFLNKGILPFKNYWEFRLRCFKVDSTGYNYKITEKGKAILSSALQKNAFILKRKEANIGGDKQYIRRICKMPDEVQKLYNDITDTFTLNDKKTIFATQKFLWLRRLCSGFVDDRFKYRFKTNVLQELIENEFTDQQAIIVSDYQCEVGTVWAFLDYYGTVARIDGTVPIDKRNEDLESFKRGDIQYLSVQGDCIKWGKDLSNCDVTIFFSSPLRPETRAQVEDRTIHCNKKTDSLIVDILTEESVDIDIRESYLKRENNSALLDRIIKRW